MNQKDTVIDIARVDDHVVLVSRHYLGSINHSLLSLELLKARGFKKVSLIFSGDEHPTTENIITTLHPEVAVIGRIDEEPYIDQRVIKYYAEQFKEHFT